MLGAAVASAELHLGPGFEALQARRSCRADSIAAAGRFWQWPSIVSPEVHVESPQRLAGGGVFRRKAGRGRGASSPGGERGGSDVSGALRRVALSARGVDLYSSPGRHLRFAFARLLSTRVEIRQRRAGGM